MYPHRDYYRNESTIRSLPVAIKTSADNSWTSVVINNLLTGIEDELDPNSADFHFPPAPPDSNYKCFRNEPPPKTKRTKLKDTFNSFITLQLLTLLFDLSNILHYIVIPYVLVFWYHKPLTYYFVYYYGILNDVIYFGYVTHSTVCLPQKRCLEWIYNLCLLFPYWLAYEEIANRYECAWVVNGLDVGFFIGRCITCPLRLYWTVKLWEILRSGEFCPIRYALRLGLIMLLLMHAGAVLWGLMIVVFNPEYRLHFPADETAMFSYSYLKSLFFAAGIMCEKSASGPIQLWPNLYIIVISLVYFLFYLYLHGFIFMDREVNNKRLIKLQYFTHTLKIHLKNRGLPNLRKKASLNYQNVAVGKKSVALDECMVMLRHVNWALVQDVLFDLNLPALKGGVVLGVKHPSVDCYLRHLSTKMRREFYNAGENIYTSGAIIDKMVVIIEGYLDVLAEDNKTSMLCLEPGTCLGQIALLIFTKSKATVKCLTPVRVVTLTKKDFLKSTPMAFPDVYRAVFKGLLAQLAESKKRKKTVMMRPPQYNISTSERVNNQLYKADGNIPKHLLHQGINGLTMGSKVGKVDQDLTLNTIWNFLMVIISVIVALAYPYFVAFERTFPDGFKLVALPMEVLIVIDLILTLITYEVPKTKTRVFEFNGRACARHLWRKLNDWSFYLDVLAAIFLEPITYSFYNTTNLDDEQINFLYHFLKLNRVIKIYKLFYFFSTLNCANEFRKRLLIHTLSICFIIYFSAVGLYLLTCFNITCAPKGWFRTLRNYEFYIQLEQPRTDQPFLSSLHASLQHIHRLDVHLSQDPIDTTISMLIFLLGYIYLTYVFVDLANLKCLQLKQAIFYKRDLHDMKKFCNREKMPSNLKHRLLGYYRLQRRHDPGYCYQYNYGNYMTTSLSDEILLAERYDTLMRVPVLRKIGKKFCRLLVLKSKIYLMPHGDIVTYVGNMNKEMLVLAQGYCEDEEGVQINPLNAPTPINIPTQTEPLGGEELNLGVIGMPSLLFNLPEGHTVTTTTPCVFISVDGSALQEALRHYPELNTLLSHVLRSQAYFEASRFNLDVPKDSQGQQDGYENQERNSFGKFFHRRSFINVLNYCAQRGEVYGDPFRHEEIAFLRFAMIPITIDPWGVFFYGWAVLRAGVALILGLTTPLMLIKYAYHFHGHPMFFLNVFCDFVLGLDFMLLCHLAFARYTGITVVHPYLTMKRFGGRSMLVDLLLAFPAEWIYRMSSDDTRMFAIIRLYKFLHVYKYFLILIKLKRLEARWLPRLIEVVKCVSCIGVLANACACLLVAIECVPLGGTKGEVLYCVEGSWIRRSTMWKEGHIAWTRDGDVSSLGQVYLLAFYWTTCLLFGVGFGHLRTMGGHNLTMVIVILLIGVFLRGYILIAVISHFTATLKQFKNTARVLTYQKMVQQLMKFLKKEELVDGAMRAKFMENAIYYWRITRGVSTTLLLSRLHTTLLQDTLCYLYEDTLSQVPLFRNMERAFLRILVLIAKPVYFLPRQVIIHQEDVCDLFYIVMEGTVHIELARSSYQVSISKGSIFGHFSKDTTPLMSIVATTVDHVHVLSFKSIDYFNILKNYAKFEIELKGVLSEYKDFMPNRAQSSEEDIHLSESWTSEMGIVRRKGIFQRVGFYKFFDKLLTIFAFLNALLIPFNLLMHHWTILYAIILVDIVFTFAFGLEFIKPHYNAMGQLITSYKETRKKHLSGKRKHYRLFEFICILIIIISNLMYFFQVSPMNLATPRMLFAYLRMVALYRCRYIGKRTFKDIDDDLFLPKLFQIIMTLLIVLHWTSCLWVLVQECIKNDYFTANEGILIGYGKGLLLMANLLTGGATVREIFRSQWEQILMVVYLTGFNMFRYFLIAKTISCLYIKVRSALTFNFQLKQLKAYVKTFNINSYQVKNLSRHLIELEKREMGKNFPGILTLLPSPLINELKILLYRPLLEKSYIFSGTQPNFQRNVAAQLRRSVYFAGDVILHHGEINKCMYFIRKGSVHIVTVNEDHSETRHDVLRPGEMFGLAQGLFRHNVPHQFTFKAVTDAEILALRLDHWDHLLRHFPRSKEMIYNRIRNAQV